jgi:hypothetical protein
VSEPKVTASQHEKLDQIMYCFAPSVNTFYVFGDWKKRDQAHAQNIPADRRAATGYYIFLAFSTSYPTPTRFIRNTHYSVHWNIFCSVRLQLQVTITFFHSIRRRLAPCPARIYNASMDKKANPPAFFSIKQMQKDLDGEGELACSR